MNHPLISVIMPVWNGETHLADSINSILSQTFTDFEFLILDDGSTDGTPEILDRYSRQDSRIRVIPLQHEGIVWALNHGISEAKGRWIARMDADDIATPDRFESQLEALERNPRAILCHSAVERFGESEYMDRPRHFPRSMAMIKARLCFSCPIIHPTVIFSKAAFEAAGRYREEERHAEDFSLWGRMVSQGDFVGIPSPLLRFRLHGASISKQKADVQQQLTRDIAARHSAWFLRARPEDCERLWNTFHWETGRSGLRDWLWVMASFLPHIKPTSIEVWAWALSQAVQRLRKKTAIISKPSNKPTP